MKLLFLFLFLASQLVALSQEVLFQRKMPLKTGWTESREAFPLMNKATNEMALLLFDKKTIKACLFNDRLQMIDSLEGERESLYDNVLGYTISDARFNFFCGSSTNRKLVITTFDFKGDKIDQIKTELEFKKEVYAGSVSHDGRFYFISYIKDTSILNIYVFEDKADFKTYTFDFKKSFSASELRRSFSSIFTEDRLTTVDVDVPNSIDVASKLNKVYVIGNKMIFTFDDSVPETVMLTVNLNDMSSILQKFKYEKFDCMIPSSANSYIYNNKLYQLHVCPDGMIIAIVDLETKEIEKRFQVSRDEDINFRNTSIMQEGGPTMSTTHERELSRTRQFLRKVANADAGISSYLSGDNLVLTIGSFEKIPAGGGSGSAPMGPFGGPGAPTYNPTYHSYTGFERTKSVYFKTVLDPALFEHKPGDVPHYAFDKIKTHTKKIKSDLTAETVFREGDGIILGYYSKKDKTYTLRAFHDD